MPPHQNTWEGGSYLRSDHLHEPPLCLEKHFITEFVARSKETEKWVAPPVVKSPSWEHKTGHYFLTLEPAAHADLTQLRARGTQRSRPLSVAQTFYVEWYSREQWESFDPLLYVLILCYVLQLSLHEYRRQWTTTWSSKWARVDSLELQARTFINLAIWEQKFMSVLRS